MSNEVFGFLEVNRGRYLCRVHGSFCDSSDGYIDHCPLCLHTSDSENSTSPKDNWTTNPVDRALQVIGNLQSRSQRNVAIVSGILAALGVGAALGKLPSQSTFGSQPFFWLVLFALISFLCLSLGAFMSSMKHVQVVDQSKFLQTTIEEWEKYLAGTLRKFESAHIKGSRTFSIAMVIFAFGIAMPFFLPIVHDVIQNIVTG